ncbi:MAG: RluA family pseudouridine synthase [Alphaproteobacteria bacterium]|nr:RluA family pseudouridine synthase [Alphaproteobacteria bacterium]
MTTELTSYAEDTALYSDKPRLDRWLRRLYPHLTQGFIEKSLRQGKILLNGKKAKASSRVNAEDNVEINQTLDLTIEDAVLSAADSYTDAEIAALKAFILWEDDDICVLNKPHGLATQGGTKTYRHLDGLLQAYGRGKPFKLVHRLDRDTSGVLIVAKTAEMASKLSNDFKFNRIKKIYWAVVRGTPKPTSGCIDVPIGKETFQGQERMVVSHDHGKPARTNYKVLGMVDQDSSWVELRPETGRTHQIRVHLLSIGHPIIGDMKYGWTKDSWDEGKKNLHLHARQITITSRTGEILTFTAPPPPHMIELV